MTNYCCLLCFSWFLYEASVNRWWILIILDKRDGSCIRAKYFNFLIIISTSEHAEHVFWGSSLLDSDSNFNSWVDKLFSFKIWPIISSDL